MKTLIIAIAYLEPSWQKTKECLMQCDERVIVVDRAGVGSMAGAYNHAFRKHAEGYDLVWFVSNVTFQPDVLNELVYSMKHNPEFAAIHPAMNSSDHPHMRKSKYLQRMRGLVDTRTVHDVPFVEFTAPLIRARVFRNIMLDEQMPYVGHDMDWCAMVRQSGFKIGVHQACEVEHVYIRHSNDHPVTRERLKNRREADDTTVARLVEKWGPNYKEQIKYFNTLKS